MSWLAPSTLRLSKTELEDLYLPYKPKRRTADKSPLKPALSRWPICLWNEPSHDPDVEAAKHIDGDKGVADTKAALDGARYILMERLPKTPHCWRKCVITCGRTPIWSPQS
ncbi:Tex-like N-terminal domain-containing protein [Salmonella enterica subsp. enterica serovar Dublin]|nr:Tex-like N-terminal domain-containing protein [Salmonella enterica]WDX21687.1 Tex-like N-terminal domain-containing protein [Salmonella enterica subsp. enterica serovar Dublin]